MEKVDGYRVAVGNPDGQRALGRPTNRWEHNIKVHDYE
jgi:hypothetical protein